VAVITALKAQRRTADRVNLFIDGEFFCGVPYEVVVSEKLRVGIVLQEDALARIREADEKWLAKQAALSLLTTRARATGELADRLRRKGSSDHAVEWAIAEVQRLGLLDDRAFAESWVRDRIKLKPRGARALVNELRRKRVSADIAQAAVSRVMSKENAHEDEMCRAAAEKWMQQRGQQIECDGDSAVKARRRLTAFLSRRGYSAQTIGAALDAVLPRR
jgi:regulatory protein